MVSVSVARINDVFPRPAGRMIEDAVAASTVFPAVPSETETLPDSVNTPEIPPGAVDTLVPSATAPTAV
jgi:hypothetical protein